MKFYLTDSPEPGLVSIITPFRNAEPFLGAAVESVRAQRYPHWELLLVNDDSSDRSERLAAQYARLFPERVRLIDQGGGWRGAAATRNLGLRHAHGQFITFLDADDVYLPGALETQVAALRAWPDAGCVCGSLQFWYSWTGRTRDTWRDFTAHLKMEPGQVYPAPALLLHNLRSGGRKPGLGGVMVRREVIEEVGAFEESFTGVAEDQIFWAKLSLQVPLLVLEECLFLYRQHRDSACARAKRDGSDLVNWQAYLNWLERYLEEQRSVAPSLAQALYDCRRGAGLQARLHWLKQAGRHVFPRKTQFWLRDLWIALRAG